MCSSDLCGKLRGFQCQQLLQRQTQSIDVRPWVRFPTQLFRGHITQRADNIAGLSLCIRFYGSGKAKVGDPQRAIGVQQQVRWLDVTMQNALTMSILQTAGCRCSQSGHVAEIVHRQLPTDSTTRVTHCLRDRLNVG